MRKPFGALRPGTIFIHGSTEKQMGLTMIKLHNPEDWARRDKDSPISKRGQEKGKQLNAVNIRNGVPSPIDPKAMVIVSWEPPL